jgi:putative flippase GtrA
VRLVRLLNERFVPERFRKIAGELMKFGAVGVVNTLLDYAVLNLLLMIGPLKAKVVATVIATTASYFMNRHWTFTSRDRAGVRREYVLFFGLNLVGLAIQLAVLGAAKYGLGFTEHGGVDDRLALNIANAFGIAIAMIFRFWAYRAFVFKMAPQTDELTADVAAAEVALADVVVTPVPRDVAPVPRDPADPSVTLDDELWDLEERLSRELRS